MKSSKEITLVIREGKQATNTTIKKEKKPTAQKEGWKAGQHGGDNGRYERKSEKPVQSTRERKRLQTKGGGLRTEK